MMVHVYWDDDDLVDALDSEPVGDGCPACGEIIDYCQGHGEMGDPHGWSIIRAHDQGDHRSCHENAGCSEEEDGGRTFTDFGDDVGN